MLAKVWRSTANGNDAYRRRRRRAQSVCDRGRECVQPRKSNMGPEGGDAAPLSWSANISRFELVEKWGLTPVLKPRQDPRPPEGARYGPLPLILARMLLLLLSIQQIFQLNPPPRRHTSTTMHAHTEWHDRT